MITGGGSGGVTAARAYRNAGFTTPAGTQWTKLPLDTKSFDPGSNFDVLTNNRYVCPVPGYYGVSGQAHFAGVASNQTIAVGLYRNGTRFAGGGMTATGSAGDEVTAASDIVFCNPGDYIELWVYTTAAIGLATNPADNFLSVQIGKG